MTDSDTTHLKSSINNDNGKELKIQELKELEQHFKDAGITKISPELDSVEEGFPVAILIEHDRGDREPIAVPVTENWQEGSAREDFRQSAVEYFEQDVVDRLERHIGLMQIELQEQRLELEEGRKKGRSGKDDDDNEKDKDRKDKKSKKQEVIDGVVARINSKVKLYFKDEHDDAYMKTLVTNPNHGDHYEIIKIDKRGKRCRLYVMKEYYDMTLGGTLKSDELKESIQVLEAKAIFSGNIRRLHFRTSWHVTSVDDSGEEDIDCNTIYYDLCTPHWTCIKIDGRQGIWEILPSHPDNVFFLRHGQKPQITPTHHYKAGILDEFLDMMRITKNENDRILMKVWLVGVFVPDIPHPILIPHGAQGSAKSTLCRFIKSLYDPHMADLLTLPSDKREATQHANHHAILIYDNVDKIPEWFSDFICQVVTGANQSKRMLYTDDDDFAYSFKRSAILNGLHVPLTKPDATDRSINTQFDRIPENERLQESEVNDKFKEMLPHMLGKIFDILAAAIRIYATIKLDSKPRMADFATWGAAIAKTFGDGLDQRFLQAYEEVMERQNVDVIEANPIGPALLRWFRHVLPTAQDEDGQFYRENHYWEGGPGQLLAILTLHAEAMGFDKKDREWPKKPFMMVKTLKPIVPDLRKAYGLDVHIFRDTTGEKTSKNSSWIKIKNVGKTPSTPSTASAVSKTNSDFGFFSGGKDSSSSNGGGSQNSPSTRKAENCAQNSDGGGSGGNGGTFGEKKENYLRDHLIVRALEFASLDSNNNHKRQSGRFTLDDFWYNLSSVFKEEAWSEDKVREVIQEQISEGRVLVRQGDPPDTYIYSRRGHRRRGQG